MKLPRISATFAIVVAATGGAQKGFTRLWDEICSAIEGLSDAIDSINTQIAALIAAINSFGASVPWTPVDGSPAGISFTVARASAIKFGSIYLCDFTLTYDITGNTFNAAIAGLPGNWANVGGVGGSFLVYTAVASSLAFPVQNTAIFTINKSDGTPLKNVDLSGQVIRAQFIVFT